MPDSENKWYAVQTRPGFEKTAFQILHGKGFELVLPLHDVRRKWRYRSTVVSLPLFPGYLFCRMDVNKRLPVLTTPGVVQIVSTGRKPAPVETFEVESIRRLAASRIAPEPWPFYQSGQQIEISSGPLCGVRGTVVERRGQYRIVVSVSLLQRSIAVELEREWLSGLHLYAAETDVPGSAPDGILAKEEIGKYRTDLHPPGRA